MNKMTTAIALAASAAVAVTGISYASAASEPVAKAAPVVEKAAPAAVPAQAPLDGGTKAVGPHSSSDGVHPKRVHEGVEVDDGVVGSFRVVRHDYGFGGHGGERGGEGGGERGEK
ncbi:hypothetical protein [Kitasatospora aureofaciens]|uniref:hypothetical protein n=1 Tax=Kitasatospora aureofaciens TaxID=1894 RepID=UPI0004CC7A0F|nr:hypothetical protein [Kitasatospora aureofaciens]